ncbi:MAG: glycosyltransferase [Bacteroidota bacterium]
MADSPPKISIIIPTLQEEKYLSRTLEPFSKSLKERFNLDIIVSDGGSSDCTVTIARTRVDQVIEYKGTQRQTISMGRNIGANHAGGDILLFLNADTIIEQPERFFRMIGEIMKKPSVVAATCKVNIYPEEELFSDKIFHEFFNYYFWLLNIIGIGMGRGECQIVRRTAFFSINGYNESMAAGEDFNLFIRLRRLGKIAFMRSLIVRESPRRFRKFGYKKIIFQWLVNSISVLLRGKSISDHWEPIR